MVKLWLRYLFWFVMWCIGLTFLLFYLLRWGPGDRLLPVRFINYFLIWWLVGLLPSSFLAFMTKRYGLALVYTLPSLGIITTFLPLYLPTPSPTLANQATIKVMSYNILYKNKTPDAAIALIQRTQPDILLLQEITPPMLPALQTTTATLYPDSPGYWVYEPTLGQAIISRYPLTVLATSYDEGRVLKVQADTPQGVIHLWNVHPHTAVSDALWLEQQAQFTAMSQALAEEFQGEPLIVGGDFNTTLQSDNLQYIQQHFTNAHTQGGGGLGFSFPAPGTRVRSGFAEIQWRLLHFIPLRQAIKGLGGRAKPVFMEYKQITIPVGPLLKIDHIFYNQHFRVHRAETLNDSGGSDHRPIVAELTWVK